MHPWDTKIETYSHTCRVTSGQDHGVPGLEGKKVCRVIPTGSIYC